MALTKTHDDTTNDIEAALLCHAIGHDIVTAIATTTTATTTRTTRIFTFLIVNSTNMLSVKR